MMMQAFFHLLRKYGIVIISTYYVPGIALGILDTKRKNYILGRRGAGDKVNKY